MGIWPWQCTPTGLDNSTELRMEKIRQAVTEIWVPQVWQPPARTVTTIPLQPGGLRDKKVIFNLTLLIDIFKSSHDNVLKWMPQDLTDDKSTLVQVMAWCRQATSHCLNQCWPMLYGITRPKWVNSSKTGYGWMDSQFKFKALSKLVNLWAVTHPLVWWPELLPVRWKCQKWSQGDPSWVVCYQPNNQPDCVQCQKLRQFAMPKTCEYWLGLVNSCVDYAWQTHEIYQILPYSVDFKAPRATKVSMEIPT